MPTYTRSTRIPVSPDTAFAYLGDVANLPHYFPRITEVERTEGDKVDTTAVISPPGSDDERTVEGEAWFHADADSRTVTWGAPGPHDYHGRLDLSGDGDAATTLRFSLHTEHEYPGVEQSIDETLGTISQNLTADAG